MIGHLPQQINPVFEFNVKEAVLMGRFCHSKGLGLTTAEGRKIADHCMNVTETSMFRFIQETAKTKKRPSDLKPAGRIFLHLKFEI